MDYTEYLRVEAEQPTKSSQWNIPGYYLSSSEEDVLSFSV